MEVRIANVGDIHALFELNALFGNTTTVELMRASLDENDGEITCIAYIGGAAAGFCSGYTVKSICHSDKRADIEALYVKEAYRGQGVGRALILCLEKAFAARGIEHFHINTYSDNAGALSLYERIGYVRSGEILLEKSL